MKNTSVRHSDVTISPVSISGASFQNVALSIITRSRTTIQSRLAMPRRWARPLAEPTAGFCPSRKYPKIFPPSIMSMTWP
jgi:hypothetical protein